MSTRDQYEQLQALYTNQLKALNYMMAKVQQQRDEVENNKREIEQLKQQLSDEQHINREVSNHGFAEYKQQSP
jgi:predicted RNase H-like nuclease (RuvC/YqgF family)